MYNKILVPVDGSELAECVLPHVESIAKGCGVKDVIFLNVVEPFYPPSDYETVTPVSGKEMERINSESEATAKRYLSKLVNRIKYDGVNTEAVLTRGKAADTIAEYATKNAVDLIVIATHGRSGVSRWVWGSVADRILRSACVPVLMVRAPGCIPGI